jgi:hypothetical protein
MKRGSLLEVVWLDAYAPECNGWMREDSHEDYPLPIKTCGYFYKKDKDYLYLYGSMSVSDRIVTMYTQPFNIPRGTIKSIAIRK